MTVLLTGAAGFIGFHTAQRLIERGENVIGIDNFNDYYDPALKDARIKALEAYRASRPELTGSFTLYRADISDSEAVMAIFKQYRPERVINLAAQAGVRYSLENPLAYVTSNIIGFTNILEACRQYGAAHLTYASTSSVYGANRQMPFSEAHGVDHPLQFYAATKRANELMAHSYSHIYRLYNIGRGAPTQLSDFIEEIERAAGKPAEKIFLPLQKGDVADTFADNSALSRDTGYQPQTQIGEGVRAFVSWYKEYHGLS